MRLLITGATGFLGSRMVHRAVDSARFEVVQATGRNRAKLEALGVTHLAADLERDELAPVLRDVDCVIHCAGLSTQWAAREDFVRGNLLTTQRLMAAAAHAGVSRIVHISTSSVYARNRDQFLLSERDPLPTRPINDYAATKIAAENVVGQAGISYATLRPRAIYGPGDTSIFPRLVRGLKTGVLPVIGSGDAVGDLTYVDDIADAALLAAHASSQGVYNITGGDPVRIWDVIRRLATELGHPPPRGRVSARVAASIAGMMEQVARRLPGRPEPVLTRYAVAQLSTSTTMDISKAMRELEYRPQVDTHEGISRLIQSMRRPARHNGSGPSGPRNPSFDG